MAEDTSHRECMAEIMAVLSKYDLAGSVTIVSKKRAMWKFYFPSWSVLSHDGKCILFQAKHEDFKTAVEQLRAIELSASIIYQMRDVAANTVSGMNTIIAQLEQRFHIEHEPFKNFRLELDDSVKD